MRSPIPSAVVLGFLAACGGPSAPPEPTTTSTSAIQGGMNDTTHSFAVGIVIQGRGGGVALCSGALLAPNLVATARHCVARISSTAIDCATSVFGAVTAASSLSVTTDPTIGRNATLYGVSQIIVPSGANQTAVCGNDLALLILSQSIALPEYVTPAINPPMTDHRTYTTTLTAIGYGVSTPTDTTGATSGVRRIKENIDLVCIPNDTTFVDCFPAEAQLLSANEFVSGNGTCDGDSGSSAFEQRSFNSGSWVSFGVLSRGGVDTDSGTCVGGIYTRFDAWGQLITDTACQAASVGGYAAPSWASCSSDAGTAAESGDAAPSSGPDAPEEAAEGAGPPSSGPEGGSCLANGTQCSSNGQCCSTNCLAYDSGSMFVCAACDNGSSPCDTGYVCQNGACIRTTIQDGGDPLGMAGSMATPQSGTTTAKGCACESVGSGGPLATSRRYAGLAGLGLVGIAFIRRRRRR